MQSLLFIIILCQIFLKLQCFCFHQLKQPRFCKVDFCIDFNYFVTFRSVSGKLLLFSMRYGLNTAASFICLPEVH